MAFLARQMLGPPPSPIRVKAREVTQQQDVVRHDYMRCDAMHRTHGMWEEERASGCHPRPARFESPGLTQTWLYLSPGLRMEARQMS